MQGLDRMSMETSAQGQWQQLLHSTEIGLHPPSFGSFQEPAVKFNNLYALDVVKPSLQAPEICWSRGSVPRG